MSLQTRKSGTAGFGGRSGAGLENATRRGEGASPFYTNQGEPVKFDDGRRVVVAGYLGRDGVFRKRVRPEHVLRKPEAVCVQVSLLEQLEAGGCETVEVEIVGRGVFRAPVARFRTRGFPVSRGFGEQVGLGLSHWDRADSPQLSLALGVAA